MSESTGVIVAEYDTGTRTDEQKAQIGQLTRQILDLLAAVPDLLVVSDVVTGTVINVALNSNLDEELVGYVVTNAIRILPSFKAARDAHLVRRAH